MTVSDFDVLPPDAALQQAIAHHEAGRLPEAEQLYRHVLRAVPGHAIANHHLGLLLGQCGQQAAALPYLEAALQADPDEGQFWLSYVEALLANGQPRDALDILRSVMQRGLDNAAVHALLEKAEAAVSTAAAPSPAEIAALVALFNGGRHAELENGARLLLQRYPDSAFAWSVLGTALQLQGKDALPAFRRTAQLSPGDPEAHCNLGNALQAGGDFDGAVASYGRALALKPGFAQVHSNLGSALQALGRLADAVASHRSAVKLAPGQASVHFNLANAFKELGQFEDAAASYRRALALEPRDAEAHRYLGNALQGLGRLDKAIACYRKALAINPGYVEAHSNLGAALAGLGKTNDAVASYQRALQINPRYAEAHSNLGNALQVLGQFDGAVASYHSALAINPAYAEAHSNLGNALRALGQLDGAAASYRRAMEIKPGAAGYTVLGDALQLGGKLDEAIASYRRALAISPAYAKAHRSLGTALKSLGYFEDALASYRTAQDIEPGHAGVHSDIGVVLQGLGQLDDAVASYRRCLALDPKLTLAHLNLGSALQTLGQHADAAASCRRALELEPDNVLARSNLLFFLSHTETLDPQALFAEHGRFGERFEAALRPGWPQHANARDPERCLQIGFVSGDLSSHAVANFVEPVLAQLAGRARLSLHGYSNDAKEDEVTRRLQGYLAHWHPVADLSDAALAQKIHADGIDILIDLSGHTAKHRLLAFARKPAPVQASWIGYPGTTGLQAMDYYLGDRFLLPPGQFDDQFTEKLVFLPANAPFLPAPDAPAVNALPAGTNGYLTFGSFNRPGKLSRTVIALWSQLLRAVPDARMLLGAMLDDGDDATLVDWFAQEGIGRERLSFHRRSTIDAYLALHHLVDVCLDTFPYTGGTTTLHALWMGVPTLTIAGRTAAGTSGASILRHIGLDALVCRDAADFVERGVWLARDPGMLAELRAGMRERLRQSPVGQPAVIADGLERALRTMWQRWCAGLPAQSFEALPRQLDDATQEATK